MPEWFRCRVGPVRTTDWSVPGGAGVGCVRLLWLQLGRPHAPYTLESDRAAPSWPGPRAPCLFSALWSTENKKQNHHGCRPNTIRELPASPGCGKNQTPRAMVTPTCTTQQQLEAGSTMALASCLFCSLQTMKLQVLLSYHMRHAPAVAVVSWGAKLHPARPCTCMQPTEAAFNTPWQLLADCQSAHCAQSPPANAAAHTTAAQAAPINLHNISMPHNQTCVNNPPLQESCTAALMRHHAATNQSAQR